MDPTTRSAHFGNTQNTHTAVGQNTNYYYYAWNYNIIMMYVLVFYGALSSMNAPLHLNYNNDGRGRCDLLINGACIVAVLYVPRLVSNYYQ